MPIYVEPSEAVERTLRSLKARKPMSHLIEVPPTCEDTPDVISHLASAAGRDEALRSRIAVVALGTVSNEAALVRSLIRQWCVNDSRLHCDHRSFEPVLTSSTPQEALQAFFAEASIAPETHRIGLVKQFDRVFRYMSRELLGALMHQEDQNLLVMVNASSRQYQALYERRRQHDPDFTSNYGAIHTLITLGPLTRAGAEQRWQEFGLSMVAPDRAFFEKAFAYSGGLPGPFRRAANLALEVGSTDIRRYSDELSAAMPDAFARLLVFDEEDRRPTSKLLASLARVHLGAHSHADRMYLSAHPRSQLLVVQQDGKLVLSTPAIGETALELLKADGSNEISPTQLYFRGSFRAAHNAIRGAYAGTDPLTAVLAEMMSEVFGDTPDDLYFSPNVKWRRVRELSLEGRRLATSDDLIAHLSRWTQIAEAFIAADVVKRSAAAPESLESMAIRLSVRILAVLADDDAVTRAYAAVPLIEEVLRVYVCQVLRLPATAEAFAGVSDEQVQRWWRRDTWRRPAAAEPLSATDLAFLAAVAGEGSQPLIGSVRHLDQLVSLISKSRNQLGHYVVTPTTSVGEELATAAAELLNRALELASVPFRVADVKAWVKPPASVSPSFADRA